MNILSFIAAVALTITLIEGLVILFKDYRSGINRLFFLITIAISIWLFGGCFGYSALRREDAFFWLKITSPGFIFMHAFILHFVFSYTGIIKSRMLYLIYTPSLFFLYVSFSDHIAFSDIYKSGNYWVMVPDYSSTVFHLLIVNYLSYYIISIVILYYHMKRTESTRIRKQSRIILIAIVITITSYNVEPFLAPLFFNYLTYGQAPIYSIVWISFIWYAMVRYRFLGMKKHYLYGEILDSLTEMVILIDNDKNVIRVNRALSERKGVTGRIRYVDDIFIEYELVNRLLDLVREKPVSAVMLNLSLPAGVKTIVKANISLFRDRFNDIAGFVIIAHNIEGANSILKKGGITEREYELIKLIISGSSNKMISEQLGISLRTVETHITNIFDKLGLKKRSELINYCTEIFSIPPK